MSVHGEYNRALETLLATLRQLEAPPVGGWIEALERARPGPDLDLSGAARLCLRVLHEIESTRSLSTPSEEPGLAPGPLRPAFEHLHAHCRAVLGIPQEIARKDGGRGRTTPIA
ncbi:MAG TPA: hypothetical protein ENI85_09935 [Deltaproteobacteria bacterium]|nr:hypothetical protein [Deltaproteobacteria bacterium]